MGGADTPAAAAGRPPRDRVLVFVADLDRPELDDHDRRHLARSLRLGPGAPLTVADGQGGWRLARFGPSIEPEGSIHHRPPLVVETAVGYAPVKGDRSELVVQKLTELGIDHIVPLLTERSVVRWDAERAARHRDRHLKISREAAMQSRNPRLPTIGAVVPLSAFLATWANAVVADPDGELPPAALSARAVVAIGPEGGFSPDELAGRETVRLPGRILRTETAAIAAGVLLAAGRSP